MMQTAFRDNPTWQVVRGYVAGEGGGQGRTILGT